MLSIQAAPSDATHDASLRFGAHATHLRLTPGDIPFDSICHVMTDIVSDVLYTATVVRGATCVDMFPGVIDGNIFLFVSDNAPTSYPHLRAQVDAGYLASASSVMVESDTLAAHLAHLDCTPAIMDLNCPEDDVTVPGGRQCLGHVHTMTHFMVGTEQLIYLGRATKDAADALSEDVATDDLVQLVQHWCSESRATGLELRVGRLYIDSHVGTCFPLPFVAPSLLPPLSSAACRPLQCPPWTRTW
jgi:hypothetical protein